jgi:ElaB/YqjD/DUF883 family membrane-anchored ribosome-binding protein
MATEADKSLSELEREAEHARADLVDTVDKLHSRVSPPAIKEEVKAYAREASYDLIHTLERRARENPLQTVAVAAGLAYPVWRFLINVPAPILMVGAGLALTQMGGSTRSIGSQEPREETRRHDASSKLSATVENLKEKAASAAGEAKSAITSGVDALGDRATAAFKDGTTSVRNAASDTIAAATDTLSDTYQGGLAAAASAGDELTETFIQSRDTLAQAIENHPFMMGGVGLLVGAVIAHPHSGSRTRKIVSSATPAMTSRIACGTPPPKGCRWPRRPPTMFFMKPSRALKSKASARTWFARP